MSIKALKARLKVLLRMQAKKTSSHIEWQIKDINDKITRAELGEN